MNDDAMKLKLKRLALARFGIQALGLYVKQLQDAKEPTMTLREIAQAILDAEAL